MTKTLKELEAMAADARPIDQSDWGSERQINAQNAFFEAVEAQLTSADMAKLDDFALKATTDESITEALAYLKGQR